MFQVINQARSRRHQAMVGVCVLLFAASLIGCATGEETGTPSDVFSDGSASSSGAGDASDTLGSSSSGGSSSSSGADMGMDTVDAGGECTTGASDSLSCGFCGTLSRVCVNGFWESSACVEPANVECAVNAEETLPCGSDMGLCSLGTYTRRCDSSCRWETIEACTGNEGVDELCDYLDNDCDDVIDNAGCMTTVYEYFESNGERAYRLLGDGGSTAIFQLYAGGDNPDPVALTALHAAYNSGSQDSLIVTSTQLLELNLTNRGLLGYCVKDLEDLPTAPQRLFSTPKSLRKHYMFGASNDTAYRLCETGVGCDNVDLLSAGYSDSAGGIGDLIPCYVFSP